MIIHLLLMFFMTASISRESSKRSAWDILYMAPIFLEHVNLPHLTRLYSALDGVLLCSRQF